MNRIRTKLAIAGVILIAAFGYLAMAGMQKGWVYFVDVDHYLSDPQYKTQRVRLHGKVATENFNSSAASLTAKFDLAGKTGALAVVYRGSIPDMFQAGREVVVEGTRGEDGIFHADVLMTKCASKYEGNSPHSGEKGGAEKAS